MEKAHRGIWNTHQTALHSQYQTNASLLLHSFRPRYWVERWNLIQCPYKNPWNSWLCFLSHVGAVSQQSQQPQGAPHLSPEAAEPSPAHTASHGSEHRAHHQIKMPHSPPSSLCYLLAASKLSQCWGFERLIFSHNQERALSLQAFTPPLRPSCHWGDEGTLCTSSFTVLVLGPQQRFHNGKYDVFLEDAGANSSFLPPVM